MKIKVWKIVLIIVCMVVLFFSYLQGICAMETTSKELDVDIRKRAEWVDKNTGKAKITLQYSSNSGKVVSTKDMNVILIHDKSGTMDANYGYYLQKVENDWMTPLVTKYYPVLNSYGWSEDVIDIQKEGYAPYFNRINYRDASSGTVGYNSGSLISENMHYSSPCMAEEHYYLMIRDDEVSNITGYKMVHGNNLQDIHNTDLHHYQRLSSRDEALRYLNQGRRVVKQSTGYYIDKEGKQQPITTENNIYFLDISEMHNYEGSWILSTCATSKCAQNDRLSLSQEFYTKLVDHILARNEYNKIAYIPFWGDVPNDGYWENLTANVSNTGLIKVTDTDAINYKNGVTKIGFTDDATKLKKQIDNIFTYRGTNWSRAFKCATDILNARNTVDKEKETLVIFLTDGVPQGYKGNINNDVNPEINGVKQLAELKSIKGVTVYACGVGVNEMDSTGLKENVRMVDEDALFVRTIDDFEELSSRIIARINEQYAISIDGVDSFYTDQISPDFLIDMDKIKTDNSWGILDSPGTAINKGVPASVYDMVIKSDAMINKVYVESNKTVYWYIGDMTNGSYTEKGHTVEFYVTYGGYSVPTFGTNINIETNTTQELTYYTTQNRSRKNTVTISTPQLIFNREVPKVTISKRITGSNFKTDQCYRFVYSRNKYASGKVENVLAEVEVIVKAEETIGNTEISNLEEGTYYFYEVDKFDYIIHPEIKSVTIGATPQITTEPYSNSIPWAITKSDESTVSNEENILRISATNALVEFTNDYVNLEIKKVWDDEEAIYRPEAITVDLFRDGVKVDSKKLTEKDEWKYIFENLPKADSKGSIYNYTVSEGRVSGYESKIVYTAKPNGQQVTITNELLIGDLTVTKIINADEIIWEHGNPIFVVRVKGLGFDGKEYTFYHTFEFTEQYVNNHVIKDKVSMSYTFKGIPKGNNYKVEEMIVSRYALSEVKIVGEGKIENSNIGDDAEFYGKTAMVDIDKQPSGVEVLFFNIKNKYQALSHTVFLKNVVN